MTEGPHLRFITLAIWLLSAIMVPGTAFAHSWYPHLCCNDNDCKVATRVERMADGSILMEAGPVIVIIPRDFVIEPSQDHQSHVCVYRDVRGKFYPRCVFMPAET